MMYDIIRRFEGFSREPYRCPAGYLTIGYGHLIRSGEIFPSEGIDEQKAEILLMQDVAKAEQAVCRLIHSSLNENQYEALVSFTFNLGSGALQRSQLRRKVNRCQHVGVPAEFMKWVWAGGRRLPGLIRRRAAEAALYAAPISQLPERQAKLSSTFYRTLTKL